MITLQIKKNVFNAKYLPYLESYSNRFEVYFGGAASGKSYFVAQKKLFANLTKERRVTLIARKVGRTNRYSTFALIEGLIKSWGLARFFRINKSDLYIINETNGNRLLFVGREDVEKLKSIAGVTDIWIEEASEITEDDFKQINLRLRGSEVKEKQIILSFNPVSANHWLKKYFFDNKPENCVSIHSTYKDNRFLSDDDRAEIERLAEVDPVYWRIYGLGEWGILGGHILTNYRIEDFEPYDFKNRWILGRQYNGIDWGFNDPAAFIKVGFHDGKIYVYDEFYQRGLDNSELIKIGKDFFDHGARITADSSEPARIKEWKKEGFKIKGAKKGSDSVRFGLDFLRRHEIVINRSCQNFISEIQNYVYRKDKNGELLEEPVDFNNHLIDALRYALEDIAHERKILFLAGG